LDKGDDPGEEVSTELRDSPELELDDLELQRECAENGEEARIGMEGLTGGANQCLPWTSSLMSAKISSSSLSCSKSCWARVLVERKDATGDGEGISLAQTVTRLEVPV